MRERMDFILRLLRVKHWSKQAFVFLGFLFTPYWGVAIWRVFFAAFTFCIAASSVYLYNDIEDIELDRKHPTKRYRPIASGDISLKEAYLVMFLLTVLSLVLALTLSVKALFIVSLYFLINIFYSHGLKHVPYVDVFCLSQGFLLRILMGTWAIDIPPSKWILLCGTALSFFLALSKRKLEWQKHANSRPVLKHYSPRSLNIMIAASSMIFILSYVSYAVIHSFYDSPHHPLVLSLPFVLIGYGRYIYLLNAKTNIDCPVSLFIHDKISVINLFCMLAMCIRVLHA